MKNSEHQSVPKVNSSSVIGELLKNSRLVQGFSTLDIANKLHLSEQYILDLEAGNYAHIGASIYVKGFLSKYAKFLGIADDENVKQEIKAVSLPEDNVSLQRMLEQSKPINIRLYPQGHERSNFTKWLGLAFVISLMIVVVIWWQNQKTHFYSAVQSNVPENIHKQIEKTADEQNINFSPTSSAAQTSQTMDSSSGGAVVESDSSNTAQKEMTNNVNSNTSLPMTQSSSLSNTTTAQPNTVSVDNSDGSTGNSLARSTSQNSNSGAVGSNNPASVASNEPSSVSNPKPTKTTQSKKRPHYSSRRSAQQTSASTAQLPAPGGN